MPLHFEIAERAAKDISSIAVYIAKRNRDNVIAERFAQRLLGRCVALTETPHVGIPHPTISGVRKINEGAYKIFYRVTETHIEILRIWDGRRGHEPIIGS